VRRLTSHNDELVPDVSTFDNGLTHGSQAHRYEISDWRLYPRVCRHP